MSPAKPKLKVTPELCEGCRPGHYDCERACKQHAIRVGKGFVYVDWERCDGCLACVEMCDTGALEARDGGAARASKGTTRLARASAGSANVGGASGRGRARTPGEPRAAAAGAPRPRAVWTEVDGLIALVVMLGALVALNVVLDLKVVTLMPPSGRVFARAAGLAIAYSLELAVIALLARRHGTRLWRALGLRPAVRSFGNAALSAILVVALLVGTRLVTTAYGVVTRALEWEPVFRWDTDLTKMFGRGDVGLVLAMALVVVYGPFVEELTFRGVVQSAARRRWSMLPSIVVTSALFAVYHFDPWMFAPTFLLGLALGWLAELRQGLWPSIALHVLYNAITVLAVFWLVSQG